MAQSGFTPIQLYRTDTAAAVPLAANLVFGELALNYRDGNLFFKDSSNVVRLLASTAAATGTVSSVQASGGTTGLTFSGGPITTSGTLTLGGTLGVANGGTGATTFTANRLVRGNGTGAMAAGGVADFSDTEAIRIDVNENVGIGTSTPARRFSVRNAASVPAATFESALALNPASLDAGEVFGISALAGINGLTFSPTDPRLITFGASTSNRGYMRAARLEITSTDETVFVTNNGERMRISAVGDVGVGITANPNFRLHVAGVSFADMVTTSVSGALGNNLYFANASWRYAGNGHGYAWAQQGTNGSDLVLVNAGNNTGGPGAATGVTERLRIAAGGNVGIGTSSPGALLHVNGAFRQTGATIPFETTVNAGATDFWRLNAIGGASNVIVALANGNVGIGTSSPAERLSVAGNITATGSLALGTALSLANGGTGATTAAAARTNLDAATRTQVDQISGFIATPANKLYRLVIKMAYAGTITETTTRSASGTCTATFAINGTALGGAANSVSSTEQSVTRTTANTFAAGDDIEMTVSANSACADLSFTIAISRVLA